MRRFCAALKDSGKTAAAQLDEGADKFFDMLKIPARRYSGKPGSCVFI